MGKSLTDLFEMTEGLDEKQELIAQILLHTSDDKDNPADLPFQELAEKVEQDLISKEEALSALDAITQENLQDGDVEEAKAFKITTTSGDEEIKTFKDNREAQDFKKNNTNVRNTEELREELDEELDNEGRMAKSDLLKLTQYSAKLYKALGDNDQLPAWIQAKITLAADYIGTVKHYLEGEQVMGGEEAPEGQLEEAVGNVEYYYWEDLHPQIFVKEDSNPDDVPSRVFLPLASDGIKQLNLGSIIRTLQLPEDHKSRFGTKETLLAREMKYVERDFYAWKEGFDSIEGDEECVVTFNKENSTAKVEVESIQAMSDKYSAGKAKGNTKDIYENSLTKILSK